MHLFGDQHWARRRAGREATVSHRDQYQPEAREFSLFLLSLNLPFILAEHFCVLNF